MRNLIAALSGLLFSIGLTVSQMVDPDKVINFLDVAGNWDPSLAFVMGGGLLVYSIAFRLIRGKRRAPLLEGRFHLPTKRSIDPRLLSGAAIFGIGWGLAGVCPGPALASLSIGSLSVLLFVASMLGGLWLGGQYDRIRLHRRLKHEADDAVC